MSRAAPHPETRRLSKRTQLLECLARGDDVGALRIAAHFPRLGAERNVILSAWDAHTTPGFARSLGRDPAAIIAAGIALVRRKWGGK